MCTATKKNGFLSEPGKTTGEEPLPAPARVARIVVAGGGAAGFFSAITCAQSSPAGTEVFLLEKGGHFLSKVRVSGGGRCNVTHACFNPRELATHYPRGNRALIGPFTQFQPEDTIAWFQARGVRLKTEPDGRMFPTTNSSQTIIDCFLQEAQKAGIRMVTHCGVDRARSLEDGRFELTLSTGEHLLCDRLILATGGGRAVEAGLHNAGKKSLSECLGHTIEPPVPSLFTFHLQAPWLRQLAGVSLNPATLSIPGLKHTETGPVLVTHFGLSGPAVLKLSAWCARELHEKGYQFPLVVNFLPEMNVETVAAALRSRSESQPGGLVINTPIRPIPARMWEELAAVCGIDRQIRWGAFPKARLLGLAKALCASEFQVIGKSPNKAEFVTCGGVRLSEVNFKTMESKLTPHLYFCGEVLDIDGITGGFNFQAAWTTGWIAGSNCGASL